MKRGRGKVMPLELSWHVQQWRLSTWWTHTYKPNGGCRCFRERVREPKRWKTTLRKNEKKQKKSNSFLSKDCLKKADFIQLHYWISLATARMAEISGRRVYYLVKGIIILSISLAGFNMNQLGHLNRWLASPVLTLGMACNVRSPPGSLSLNVPSMLVKQFVVQIMLCFVLSYSLLYKREAFSKCLALNDPLFTSTIWLYFETQNSVRMPLHLIVHVDTVCHLKALRFWA